MKVVVDQRSVKLVSDSLKRFVTETTPVAKRAGSNAVKAVVLSAVRANISAPAIGGSESSHSAGLAALDHPYARRHPQITLSPSGGGHPGFRRRRLLVHTVSGDLLGALRGRVVNGDLSVWFDTAAAPHAEFVVAGTQVMHPRDVLFETSRDRSVTAPARRALIDAMRGVMGF